MEKCAPFPVLMPMASNLFDLALEAVSPNSIARMFRRGIIQLIDASFLWGAYRFTFTAW